MASNFHDNYTIEDWISYIATIGTSASLGLILGGPIGGMLSLSTSLLDEYLNNKISLENKHYVTRSVLWGSIATKTSTILSNLLPTYKWLFYSTNAILAPLISYFSDDFLDYKARVDSSITAFITLNKLFSTKEVLFKSNTNKAYDTFSKDSKELFELTTKDINAILNNQFLVNYSQILGISLSRIIVENLLMYYMGTYGQGLLISNLLNAYQNANLITIIKEGTKISSLFLVKKIFDFVSQIIEISLLKKQYALLIERSTEILLEDSNGKKLTAHAQGKELIDKLNEDLLILLQGVSKLNAQLLGLSKAFISTHYLSNLTPEAFIFYLIPFLSEQALLTYTSANSKFNKKQLSEKETKAYELKFHISNNLENINLRDGKDYIEYQYKNLLTQKIELQQYDDYLNKLLTGIKEIKAIFNVWLDVLYFAYKFIYTKISIAQIPLIKKSLDDFFAFLSGDLDFHIENTSLFLAKERVDKFIYILSSYNTTHTIHTTNDLQKIILDKYILSLDSQPLIKIDHLEFEAGKYYAITGKSGCGKTSILKDIKEGLLGAVTSSGTISLPNTINGEQTKIMFINQDLYIPLDSTLLEVAYFPSIFQGLAPEQKKEVRTKVIKLFQELEIDEFVHNPNMNEGLLSRLDSKDFKFSGGQSKKIATTQVILNKPNIIMADELTSDLDKHSLIKVEHALTKYLPNSLILSVEHHAEDNNYDNFYDCEVNFSKEHGVTVNYLHSKESNVATEQPESITQVNNSICLIDDMYSSLNISYMTAA